MKEYKNSGLLNGRSGAWYGEKGTIPMVMEDREGRILLMYTKWSSEPFTRKDLERNLRYLVNCDVNPDQYYIFAKSGFDAAPESTACKKYAFSRFFQYEVYKVEGIQKIYLQIWGQTEERHR